MQNNPFTNRGMIQEESAFVGRSREIANIINRLRNGSSVSLVGERRIGKSSLLYHLLLTGNRRLGDEAKSCYRFFYLDMHNAKVRKPAHFTATILHEMGIVYNAHDNEKLQERPMFVMAEALEEWQRQGNAKPILLLDEFEEITKHKDLFTDEFLEALRSFCNGGLMTLMTSSRLTLKAMTDRGDLTSPFWNIFYLQELKEFCVDHKLDEVNDFIHYFWREELKPKPNELNFLQRYRSRHPLKLQVVSYWLLQNRELEYPRKKLKQEIRQELHSYFRTKQERMTNWMKRTLPGVPDAITATTGWIGKQMDNLNPLSKLLK